MGANVSNRRELAWSEALSEPGQDACSLSLVNQHDTFSNAKGWSLFQLPQTQFFSGKINED